MTYRPQMRDYAPEGKTTRLHPWVELTGMDVMDVSKHFKAAAHVLGIASQSLRRRSLSRLNGLECSATFLSANVQLLHKAIKTI